MTDIDKPSAKPVSPKKHGHRIAVQLVFFFPLRSKRTEGTHHCLICVSMRMSVPKSLVPFSKEDRKVQYGHSYPFCNRSISLERDFERCLDVQTQQVDHVSLR